MSQDNSSLTTLTPFVGSMERLLQVGVQQKKWLLIVLFPNGVSYPPPPLQAPEDVQNNVLLWRRQASSPDASRYSAFYPIDKVPHVALLDPRSGERLLVWTRDDGGDSPQDKPPSDCTHSTVCPQLWDMVLENVSEFLPQHSLEEFALGPTHFREKPYSVRTRRISETSAGSQHILAPTSVMDDEKAAIAAAIAASLKDIESPSDGDVEMSDNDGADDEELALSSDTSSEAGLSTPSVSTAISVDFGGASQSSEQNGKAIPLPSKPVVIIRKQANVLGSSVESLSSSYLERMASCLRASTDPALLETRRLRQEQDDELRAALESDRVREAREHEDAMLVRRTQILLAEAQTRLPEEPHKGTGVCIALRFPDGQRVSRRFNIEDRFSNIGDWAIIATNGGLAFSLDLPVQAYLKSVGVVLDEATWHTKLCDMPLGRQAAFFVQLPSQRGDA